MKDILLDNQVDIKDLKTESPEDDAENRTFDPQTEISEQDWREIRRMLEGLRKKSDEDDAVLDKAIRSSLQIQILTGEPANLTKVTRLKRLRRRLFGFEEVFGGTTALFVKADTADLSSDLLLLVPALRKDLELARFMPDYERHFATNESESDFYALERFNAKVILGDKCNELRVRNKQFFDKQQVVSSLARWGQPDEMLYTHELLDVYGGMTYEFAQAFKYAETPMNWFKVIACARILMPGSENKYLSNRNWRVMKEWLNGFRMVEEWRKFLELAYNMYLLSAENVQITSSGLVVSTSRQEFEETVDSLPQTRSYQ